MNLTVRQETTANHAAVADLIRAAFSGDGETRLVDHLRAEPGFIPELSLVAEHDSRVIGHILFTSIVIRRDALTDCGGVVEYPPAFAEVA